MQILNDFPLECDSDQHWSCPNRGEYVYALSESASPEKLWCREDGLYDFENPLEKYSDFASLMDSLGYAWEAHEVKTEDGWNLSMFRINHHVYDDYYYWDDYWYQEDIVVVQHGLYSDAQNMLESATATDSLHWVLELVDNGYDVWLPNNRGTRYSSINDNDSNLEEQDRWNFSWAEMGLYDQPAFMNKILAET